MLVPILYDDDPREPPIWRSLCRLAGRGLYLYDNHSDALGLR